MAVAVVWIVMLGALLARIGMPLWLILVLGAFVVALSPESGDRRIALRVRRRKKTDLRILPIAAGRRRAS
jgi:hypothetical protein